MTKRDFGCPRKWGRAALLPWVGAALIVAQWAAANSAWAQDDKTTRAIVAQILGPSIPEITAKYSDIEKAVRAFGDNNVDEASKILTDVKAKNPEVPPAGVMLANLFVLAQNQPLARGALEKAVQDDPGDPEAYIAFGDDAFQQRRFAESELLYEKAMSTAESYKSNDARQKLLTIRALAGKAAVLEARGYWEQAVPVLRKITAMNPENVNLQSRLGRALFKHGRREDAAALFQELYTKHKDLVDRPEVNIARLFQQEEGDKDAEKYMTLALKNDPNSIKTQLSVAQWALETGRIDLAKKCAAAAKKLEGSQASVNLLEGVLMRYDKNINGAEAAFQAAHLASPSNPVAINQLAIVLIEQPEEEKRQRALEYATLNTRQFSDANNPSAREASVTYAWVLYKLGRVVEAERLILQTVQQTKLQGDSAYFAAAILKDRNRADVAKQVIQPALDAKGVFPLREEAKKLIGP